MTLTRIYKKVICLLAALCMMIPMAAVGEETELNVETLFPIVEQLKIATIEETKEILRSTWQYYYENAPEGTDYYWYMMESSIYEETFLYEFYLEFLYQQSRFARITVVRSTDSDYPLILVNCNGEEPSLELVAKYFGLDLYAYEIRDEDEKNYQIEFTMELIDVK